MLRINDRIIIDDAFIHIRYIRSRGPGGQNVNKVNTCAQLAFDLKACRNLPPPVKHRLRSMNHNRINKAGELILESDRFRTQYRNRQSVLDLLRKLVLLSLVVPKKRIPTRPGAAARRKRRLEKQHRSRIKSLRKSVLPDE